MPGGEQNDSSLINSGEQIKKYIQNRGEGEIYMYSCYFWYTVGNYGKHTETFSCIIWRNFRRKRSCFI